MGRKSSYILRAADLLTGPYSKNECATMLGQSKNIFQSEIDAGELADFFRYNVQYMTEIYSQQPRVFGAWNRMNIDRWKVLYLH
ncbi:MAG: hypothetical protein LC127_02985 [Chitinophagales bacterium]|nr:hypothetical protein [Chitinophagales bacterium]